MVNKQYNVQQSSKNKSKNLNSLDAKEQLKQSITVIPNETIINGSSGVRDIYRTQNAFERNITQQYYHSLNDSFDSVDGHFENKRHTFGDDTTMASNNNNNHMSSDTAAAAHDTNDTQSQKQLSIDDIERFQYILQMDREMVSGPSSQIDFVTVGLGSGQSNSICTDYYYILILILIYVNTSPVQSINLL